MQHSVGRALLVTLLRHLFFLILKLGLVNLLKAKDRFCERVTRYIHRQRHCKVLLAHQLQQSFLQLLSVHLLALIVK